jgi:TM2 domain-containing membrane protein YozV
MIVPIAIGISLLQHAYQHLNDGKLFSSYSGLARLYGGNISAAMALICYTLVPIAIACMLATPLLVMSCDLDMTHKRFEVVTN